MSGAPAPSAVRPGSLRAWILAARPATLSAAVVPVVVGTACTIGEGGPAPLAACLALWGAVWIQIGTNFANDLFDFEKGADTEARMGPTRVVQSGLITPRAVKVAMVLSFLLAMVAGLGLVWIAGWPVVIIGVASILSGIAYTGGPYPLGYNGLGDLFVLLFFGFVAVGGTTFVQTASVPVVSLWAGLAVGSVATAILVVYNIRDAETDTHAGKRTLVVRWGRTFGIAWYGALLTIAYGVPPLLLLVDRRPWVLLPWLTAPVAVSLVGKVARRRGPDLNPVLAGTARLLLAYGLLLAVGLVLGAP
ncbi:MAG: 1,4-dihydroxy-2-naphthoate polyprenyltransferase [Myxococcales bacterium]|nr:1,4-dihydroxy-2-naphthoate polyprenyltransferase [Myxococcales bacterium]